MSRIHAYTRKKTGKWHNNDCFGSRARKRFVLGPLRVKILNKMSKERMVPIIYNGQNRVRKWAPHPLRVQNALTKLQEKKLIEQTNGKYRIRDLGNTG